MYYCRKLYFEKATGKMILWYLIITPIPPNTMDQDFELEQDLFPYKNRRDEVGLIQWDMPNEEIDRAFEHMDRVHVDVSGSDPIPVFHFPR